MSGMDPLILLFVYLLSVVVSLLILFFVVKAAVLEGLKEHTRWTITNRAELEAKYAKRP
jgi:hypothetical protein